MSFPAAVYLGFPRGSPRKFQFENSVFSCVLLFRAGETETLRVLTRTAKLATVSFPYFSDVMPASLPAAGLSEALSILLCVCFKHFLKSLFLGWEGLLSQLFLPMSRKGWAASQNGGVQKGMVGVGGSAGVSPVFPVTLPADPRAGGCWPLNVPSPKDCPRKVSKVCHFYPCFQYF